MLKRYLVLIICWLCLGPVPPSAAQNSPEPVARKPAAEATTASYPGAAEVIPRLSKLREDASAALARIETLEVTAPFRGPLRQARERQAALDLRLKELGDPATWNVERLIDIRGSLAEQRNLLKKLLETVSTPVTELDGMHQAWIERRDFWSHWAEALRGPDFKLPAEAFAEARKTIEKVLSRVGEAVDQLIALQKEVTALQDANLARLNRVEASLDALRRETFRKTAPSFANPAFYRQFDAELWRQVGTGSVTQGLPADFLRSQGWIAGLQVLVALFLGGFIRSHRHDPEVADEWRFILKHPWATGIFVAVAGLGFIYAAPPAFLRLLLWLLAVGSGSVLTAGLLDNRRKTFTVFFLAVLFLASLGLQNIGVLQPLYRLYLALVTLLSIPVLWQVAVLERRASKGRGTFFSFALKVGCLVLLAAFASQCSGYTVLSSRLFEASLETVFLGILTAMTMRLMRGGVEFLFAGRTLRRSRFVRRAGSDLAARFKGLFDLFVLGYGGLYLLVVWGLFDSVPQAWEQLLSLGFQWGETPVSVRTILLAGIVVYLAIVVSWIIREVLEWEVFPRKGLDRGVRDAVKKLLHYGLVFFGFLFAVSLAGIDLKNFAVVAGALGIGIGFGLQNVVNNFVSGIILLFERPIKVGDMVVLDGEWGTIRKIGLRSTVVETFDQSEIIVPNSDLVSQKVTNWTLTTKVARVVLPVGVAYGSDLEKVLKILQEAGSSHPLALKEPQVSAIFVGFGNSSLDFELRVWVEDIGERLRVRSELGQDVDRRFREAGVEIPFPQRDLHLRSVEKDLLGRVLAPVREYADAPLLREKRGEPGTADHPGKT
jgi:small-conductance mechanosensitive channel